MSRTRKGSPPAYRFHKARNCGVVTIDGKDHYLGSYGTPASRQKYASLIRAWEQRSEASAQDFEWQPPLDGQLTVNDLILPYLRHARDFYKPNQGENKEAGCIADALRVLQNLFGREPADDFRPTHLLQVRQGMIELGWSRQYVNRQVGRVKRMFAFAAERDMIRGTVHHSLLAVKGLRKNTPAVCEAEKVRPVPVDHINQVLRKAPTILAAMIRFAYHTGARPGEVCALKPCHIDRKKSVWVYAVPDLANKTDHYDQNRTIYIGPKARKALKPLLVDLVADAFVFSPARAEVLRNEQRKAARKTPRWPSHVRQHAKKKSANPRRPKRDHYDPSSFRRAVKRLCDVVGVPRWSPNQLRHNAGTRFRRKYGLEVARILLGHRKMNTTEIYAEADAGKARRAASKIC